MEATASGKTKLWMEDFCLGITELQPAFITALRQQGIACRNFSAQDSESLFGLIVLDSERVLARVGQCLQDRIATAPSARIIVATLGKEPLSTSATWLLLEQGAAHVLPFEGGMETPHRIAEQMARWQVIETTLATARVAQICVGQSRVWQDFLREVIEIAMFSQSTVLLIGESGTGKELVAKLIHVLDARRDKGQQILVDCSTLASELSGSEFFGHEKGAFTSAVSTREGAFALANRGTLFLDEVGDLPARMQAELLRVAQEGMFKKLGSNHWEQTNFRMVCATHRHLPDEVAQQRFRLDFFYRISSCTCHLPPLRTRREDIPLLAQHFFRQFLKNSEIEMDNGVREFLAERDYPGNIRELRHLVGRIALRYCGKGTITLGDVPTTDRPMRFVSDEEAMAATHFEAVRRYFKKALESGSKLKDIKEIAADIAIQLALEEMNGSLQQAADRLGVTDRALQIRRASLPKIEGSFAN